MEKSRKYWIDPAGAVLPVGVCHVAAVIADPGRFGCGREEVEACYRGFGEPLGLEGRARGVLVARVLRSGWVRVKYHPRADCWEFQVWETCWDGARRLIEAFLAEALATGVAHRNADLLVYFTHPQASYRLPAPPPPPAGTLMDKWRSLQPAR